jgi:hypothetical protein
MKQAMTMPGVPNSGHGHVLPRPDKAKARCGGPSMCQQCAGDQEALATNAIPGTAAPQFSEGEQVALLVAGTINRLERELERTRGTAAKLDRALTLATDTLAALLKEWPETTWAHDSVAKDNAQAVLDQLTDPEAGPEPTTLDGTPPS